MMDIYKDERDCFLHYAENVNFWFYERNQEEQTGWFNLTTEKSKLIGGAFLNWQDLEYSWSKWNIMNYIAEYCQDWKENKVSVNVWNFGYWNIGRFAKIEEVSQRLFAILTTCWIFTGGLAQFCIILYLMSCRKDSQRLSILPKPIQIILLMASPILLGPVVVHVYGIYVILFKKVEDDTIQLDVKR